MNENSSRPPRRLTRRRLLQGAAAATALGGLGTLGYAWRVEPHWIEVVHRELPLRGLSSSLNGSRLVQISDLHLGAQVSEDYIIEALDRVGSLNPDFFVITGDFVTFDGKPCLDALRRVAPSLARGNRVSIAILGNHDYGHRFDDEKVAAEIESILKSSGVKVLRNALLQFDGLQIFGLDDLWGSNFEIGPMMKRANPERGAIALCHNPDGADRGEWGAFQGWILCGHTHGGQCSFPLIGTPILPVRNKSYVSGAIDLGGGRMMSINRGLGHLQRIRFRARPEITVFTLTERRA